jgi:hypothetical protein
MSEMGLEETLLRKAIRVLKEEHRWHHPNFTFWLTECEMCQFLQEAKDYDGPGENSRRDKVAL